MMYPRLPDGDPVRMSVVDYVTRVRSDVGGSLAGRQVELTGYLGSAPDGGHGSAPYGDQLLFQAAGDLCRSPRRRAAAGCGPRHLASGDRRAAGARRCGGPAAGTAYLSVTAATVVSEATGRQW